MRLFSIGKTRAQRRRLKLIRKEEISGICLAKLKQSFTYSVSPERRVKDALRIHPGRIESESMTQLRTYFQKMKFDVKIVYWKNPEPEARPFSIRSSNANLRGLISNLSDRFSGQLHVTC